MIQRLQAAESKALRSNVHRLQSCSTPARFRLICRCRSEPKNRMSTASGDLLAVIAPRLPAAWRRSIVRSRKEQLLGRRPQAPGPGCGGGGGRSVAPVQRHHRPGPKAVAAAAAGRAVAGLEAVAMAALDRHIDGRRVATGQAGLASPGQMPLVPTTAGHHPANWARKVPVGVGPALGQIDQVAAPHRPSPSA